jgi:dethiobiotin synthetase
VRGVFVTGTGTGVGKSVVAAAICALLAGRGERVAAYKPVVTGLDESDGRAPDDESLTVNPTARHWPPDHELLARAAGAGQAAADVAPYRFGPAVSPHFAAELAGATIEPARLVAAAQTAAAGADAVVCEGIGGLLVPITREYLVRDLAVDLGLPLVVAAATGLGTINHTLLTVEVARAAGLNVNGVVMTPWPERPARIEVSNRTTVERLSGVPVSGLPPAEPGSLAEAAEALPINDWL